LKLSYDGLDDDQKDIFLDIACFYRGERENVVEQTLGCCGFSARIGMDVLEDRCLISISKGNVWMHDLIQDMGHEIVRLQDKDPLKRSRLWKADDICDVFKMNMVCSLVLKSHLIPDTLLNLMSLDSHMLQND
jgi:hypothetical protein